MSNVKQICEEKQKKKVPKSKQTKGKLRNNPIFDKSTESP